jgi:hypothetical protein
VLEDKREDKRDTGKENGFFLCLNCENNLLTVKKISIFGGNYTRFRGALVSKTTHIPLEESKRDNTNN